MQWQRPIDILMVEDNLGDIELTKLAFRHFKVKVKLNFAFDGDEGLKYLLKKPPFENALRPDIILMDISMPRMNGFELLKIIKENESLKATPVIMLTSSDTMLDIQKAYKSYANSYLVKPVVLEQFKTIIRAIESFWIRQSLLPSKNQNKTLPQSA